ncbi:MAG: carbohydrate diacid transcriptional activator CdaR [Firmicutes bacterium]|nr:carbohydrate diacid transcriptional activator CdaR [Bacillota bacterium]
MTVYKTILIDDEKPALKVLAHLLKSYSDIEITGSFTDITNALEYISTKGTDLIFCDIDMPTMNGIQVAKKLMAINPDTNIVFVTAYTDFALDAFEVNAIDYIMKPVSKKRLDSTMERLAKKLPLSNHALMRQQRRNFFNDLITGKIMNGQEIMALAKQLHLDLTQSFSFFFLRIGTYKQQSIQAVSEESHSFIISIIDKLSAASNIIAWETTSQGISILNFTPLSSEDCRTDELAMAENLQAMLLTHFPEIAIFIGIAERELGMNNFTNRYIQARNTVVVGMKVSPDLGIYHFSNSGLFPLLAQSISSHEADFFINNTIDKIIEYDHKNGTDLFHTMELIVINNNLRSVAEKLFVHYKTVLFRKQSIEKILEISMDSFEGRTMLGTALTLYYLREYRSLP